MFRVDKPDVERLDLIEAANPKFIVGMKTAHFDISKIPLEDMIEELANVYQSHYHANQKKLEDRSGEELRHGIIEPEALEDLRREAIDEYALWNIRWHEKKKEWRTRKSLKALVAKLPFADSIGVTAMVNTRPRVLHRQLTCV